LGFFKNLKINAQIVSIGVTSLVGIVVIAVIYFYSAIQLDAFQKVQLRATEGRALTELVRYQFLEARRIEKDFLLKLGKSYVSDHKHHATSMSANLERLSEYTNDEASALLNEEMTKGFHAYVAQFKKVAASWKTVGFHSRTGLRRKLSDRAKSAQNKTASFYNDELNIMLINLRLLEKDFLISRKKKDLRKLKKEFEVFMTNLSELGIPDEDLESITEEMNDYRKGLDSVAKIFSTLKTDTRKMDQLFSSTGPLLDELLEARANDFNAAVANAQANSKTTKAVMALAIVVVAVTVFAIGFLIGRGIVGPIGSMTGAMTDIADGDTSIEVPATDYGNELGRMAGAVQAFKDNLIRVASLEAEQSKQNEAQQKRANVIDKRTGAFDGVVTAALEDIKVAASQMQKTSQSMTSTADEASSKSSAVAAAAEEASANVQTVAAAAEELSASITEIGRQAEQSRDISNNAVNEVKNANEMVEGLAAAAQEIGDVVQLITDIAEQTNLLALNATIEAARAGDAGKGFAVVASEVKNLASQTARATEDISSQIGNIQSVTDKSVSAIKDIGQVVDEVNQIAMTIAAAVEQQNAATQEISRNVDEAAAGTNDVTENISGVAQAAQETGAATGQVLDAAGQLERQADALRSEVNSFLSDIKAA
jgi:methyl-accepting chemotaxis protein